MPTVTFFNLPKEKQEKILNSARKEFSSCSYAEVSINKIIKEAGISRGSFYMYFINKEDIYIYLLKNELLKLQILTIETLKEKNGDLINSFKNIFSIMCKNIIKKENTTFIKMIIENMTYSFSMLEKKKAKPKEMETAINEIISLTNLELVKEQYHNNIIYIIEMIKDCFITSMMEILVLNKNILEVEKKFNFKLDTINYGISKDVKNESFN